MAQRTENAIPFTASKPRRKNLYQSLKTFSLYGTQIGGTRPLSSCAFAPDSKTLATGCFSGELKVWSMPDCGLARELRGHHARVDGVSWHPLSGMGQPGGAVHLASGDADGKLFLWNMEGDQPMHELEGHAMRVTKTAFHPSGRFLGSAR